MSTFTYLDWCPVSAVPVFLPEDYPIKKIIKEDYKEEKKNNFVDAKLFNNFSELLSYSYTYRTDGFFIFRIETDREINTSTLKEIANNISDFIKHKLGHRHEFHNDHSPYYEPSSFVYTIAPLFIKNYFLNNNNCFFVSPIQVEDNKSSINKLILPRTFDEIKAVPNNENKFFNKRACLLLYSLYSQKKQRFFDVYKNEEKLEINKLLQASVLPFIVFLVMLSVTHAEIAFVASTTIFLMIYLKFIKKKVFVIYKAIGYFNYLDIYSKIISNFLEEKNDKITIGYSNIIGCLEAKAKIEESNINNKRYILGVFFTLIAIIIGLLRLKLAIDVPLLSGSDLLISPQESVN